MFLIILSQIILIVFCVTIVFLSYEMIEEKPNLPKIVIDNEVIIGNNSSVVVTNDDDWE